MPDDLRKLKEIAESIVRKLGGDRAKLTALRKVFQSRARLAPTAYLKRVSRDAGGSAMLLSLASVGVVFTEFLFDLPDGPPEEAGHV